jgi:MipA family protein
MHVHELLRWIALSCALLTPGAAAQDSKLDKPGQPEPAEEDEAEQALPEPLLGTEERSSFQKDWGIAALMRTAQIPYGTEDDSVSSFVPMMFYEGEHVFLRGLGAGVHAWHDDDTEVNLFTRLRFVDIPREYQNQIQADTGDFGVQFHRDEGGAWWEAEALSDLDGKWQLAGRVGTSGIWGNLLLTPSLDFRYLSDRYTTHYYAMSPLTGQTAGGGFQVSPSAIGRFHLFSDLYLVGSLRYTWSSSEITDLAAVEESGVAEAMIGFGFFQDTGDPQFLGEPRHRAGGKKPLKAKPYVRLAHGWATESDLGEILRGDITNDEYDNQMTSAFYGHPLTDTLFGAPLEIYLSPGFAWHHDSSVQSSTPELVLKIKAYYTFLWPIRWRLGAAEGVSWIDDITYIEQISMDEKGNRPSQYMNYLDFSLDLNVGDLVGLDGWDRIWAGVAIHHRSSIFESASQFGRISGGSNYPSIYLQYDLY